MLTKNKNLNEINDLRQDEQPESNLNLKINYFEPGFLAINKTLLRNYTLLY